MCSGENITLTNKKLLFGDLGISNYQHREHLSGSFCVLEINNSVIFQLWLSFSEGYLGRVKSREYISYQIWLFKFIMGERLLRSWLFVKTLSSCVIKIGKERDHLKWCCFCALFVCKRHMNSASWSDWHFSAILNQK